MQTTADNLTARANTEPTVGGTLASGICEHCGTPCRNQEFRLGADNFCCAGCRTVFELLKENGLDQFYQLNDRAGVRVKGGRQPGEFDYLDDPVLQKRLLDFDNGKIARITLRIPAIHCVACVWLLENLFRLLPGIGNSQVNFPARQLSLQYLPAEVKLSQVVALLASLGYEPEFSLSDLDSSRKRAISRRVWLQIGLAGFAFGNIMLFNIPAYLGLDSFSGPTFQKLLGAISFLLALPVVTYSSADYWKSAWVSLRQKRLAIEVPIAAGIAALFLQSCFEVFTGRGEGYFDSLSGLLFFLLCGRLFQQKTYSRLVFDRDYTAFFPLSVTRKAGAKEERVPLERLAVGDILVVRNGELIPADGELVEGPAVIDYSFVTGESEPVEKTPGDYLYSGGRQVGRAIEVRVVKPVSQSYLTSLWDQEAFKKVRGETIDTLTNRYSQRFTKIVLLIALGSAAFWAYKDPSRSVKAFASVLIVACPCALALAAPFTLGTAQRLLARRKFFLKNTAVLETLAQVDTVVFDKTGTLTAAGAAAVTFQGAALTNDEQGLVFSLTRHSTHPYAVRIHESLAEGRFPEPVRSFLETIGCGLEAVVGGHEMWLGSEAWLVSRNAKIPAEVHAMSGVCHLAIDGKYRGSFMLRSGVRPQAENVLSKLGDRYQLALLSGDNDRDLQRFQGLFPVSARLHFNQSPLDKLNLIQQFQREKRTVMMVGDGLNDAGALKQSDVGVAVVESVSAFSPASDVITAVAGLSSLNEVLAYSRRSVRVVRLSFLISSLYNVVGISIAARGALSPVVCAILMPLSSITVVVFACAATTWLGRSIPTQPSLGAAERGMA